MAVPHEPLPPDARDLFDATDDLIASLQRALAEWRSVADSLDTMRDEDSS